MGYLLYVYSIDRATLRHKEMLKYYMKKKSRYTKKISLRLPIDQLQVLQVIAHTNGVTISDVVRWTIKKTFFPPET